MLRVWGGGLYESEHFYELCDEHGILVWQDFGYACAYYPDEDAYLDTTRTEAVAVVRRIRTHPSLAIWCGNNENDWMYQGKWGGDAPDRFLGENIYHQILPAVVTSEDPKAPYWPSSPFGGSDVNSPDSGDRHNWDVWHGVGDWTHYAVDNARFVSEFGFAASCSLAAWETCLDDDDKSAHSAAVRWHDKTRKGYDAYLDLVRLHYPPMQTIEDLVYYTQLNQADALKFAVEHYRRLKGSAPEWDNAAARLSSGSRATDAPLGLVPTAPKNSCWGTLFWQFNDCWPAQSWSVIDSALQPKAAYYASRSFYAPILLSLRRTPSPPTPLPSKEKEVGIQSGPAGGFDVFVTNDTLGPVNGEALVRLKTFAGDVLLEAEFAVDVEPNGNAQVGSFDLRGGVTDAELYVSAVLIDRDGAEIGRNLILLGDPKELVLTAPNLNVAIAELDDDTFAVTIGTDTFAGSVWLFTDRIDGGVALEFSDNFFHLEDGESRTVTAEMVAGVESVEDLRSVLRVRTLWGECDLD
jgi:beta-mannosidase